MIPEPQRTYLLELLTALGPAADGLVLAGAQALKFIIGRPRATKDFDFVLDVVFLRESSISLASVLSSLGYGVIENARNFQFQKQLPVSAEVMRVEFMAPAEYARNNDIRVEVQEGIHGRACVGGSIVLVETDESEISGSLPDGKPAKAKVRVTRPHALAMLKLLAMDDRYRNVRGSAHAEHDREEARTHAADLVAVMTAQTDLAEFRRRFAGQFGGDGELKNRAHQIIQDYFPDISRPGLILYRERLAADLPAGESVRELENELRRAQRLVASLILE